MVQRVLSHKYTFAYALLLPAVLTVAAVTLWPALQAVNLSFHKVSLPEKGKALGEFTLANYARLISHPDLSRSVSFSLLLTVVTVVLAFLVGLGLAVLLNQPFRGRSVARMLAILPWAVPEVVAANIFWLLLDQAYGPVNYMLMQIGIIKEPVAWFVYSGPAMIGVIMVTLWKGYPFFTMMLLAGLQAIPKDLYEAAEVDGATGLRSFFTITLPALRHIIATASLLSALWVFRSFGIIFLLTGGGPAKTTETLAIWNYREAFSNFNMGFSAAIGAITLVISVVASIFFIRQTRQEFY